MTRRRSSKNLTTVNRAGLGININNLIVFPQEPATGGASTTAVNANHFGLNSTRSNTNVLAAGNMVRPTTFANGNSNRPGSQLSGSLKAGKQFRSSLNQISSSLSKTVQKALSGFGNKKKQNSEPETGGDS